MRIDDEPATQAQRDRKALLERLDKTRKRSDPHDVYERTCCRSMAPHDHEDGCALMSELRARGGWKFAVAAPPGGEGGK